MKIKHTCAAIAVLSTWILWATPASADDTRKSQWHLDNLKIAQAHTVSRGEGVVVAVIDTGVQDHRDFAGGVIDGTSTIPGKPGNGKTDTNSHGTGMAGLIASRGRGGNDGALGIAPGARILPIRFFENDDDPVGGTQSQIVTALDFAIERGARVINISLRQAPSRPMMNAVSRALEKDIVIVASIGNSGLDISGTHPAILPGVVAVGATDRQNQHATVSTRDKAVMLCAPGVELVSTSINNGYRRGTGTSGSAAIVSGTAALIRSKFPEISAKEVINRLTATADDEGPPGRDDGCGYGMVNPVKALTADVPPLAGAATPSSNTSASASKVALPGSEVDGSSSIGTMTIVGVVGGLVVIGALAAFLLARRRPADGPTLGPPFPTEGGFQRASRPGQHYGPSGNPQGAPQYGPPGGASLPPEYGQQGGPPLPPSQGPR